MWRLSTGGWSAVNPIPNMPGILRSRMDLNQRFGSMIFSVRMALHIAGKRLISSFPLLALNLPAKSSQLLFCRIEILMDNSPDTQCVSHLHKKRTVFQIYYFFGRNLGYVERHFENIRIRFSEMNKTGTDKKINEFAEFKFADP